MVDIYNICWLFLAQGGPPGATETVEKVTEEAAKQPEGLFGLGYFLPAMIAVMVLWFLMMKPQDKPKGARASGNVKDLKKNDWVVTAGGIRGLVVNNREDSDFVTLRVEEKAGTKLEVLRSSIARVESGEKE